MTFPGARPGREVFSRWSPHCRGPVSQGLRVRRSQRGRAVIAPGDRPIGAGCVHANPVSWTLRPAYVIWLPDVGGAPAIWNSQLSRDEVASTRAGRTRRAGDSTSPVTFRPSTTMPVSFGRPRRVPPHPLPIRSPVMELPGPTTLMPAPPANPSSRARPRTTD